MRGKDKNSHLAGLEPATFRLTAERANQLRHKCSDSESCKIVAFHTRVLTDVGNAYINGPPKYKSKPLPCSTNPLSRSSSIYTAVMKFLLLCTAILVSCATATRAGEDEVDKHALELNNPKSQPGRGVESYKEVEGLGNPRKEVAEIAGPGKKPAAKKPAPTSAPNKPAPKDTIPIIPTSGAKMCLRNRKMAAHDYISQNFFDKHVCVYKDKPPSANSVNGLCGDYAKSNKFEGVEFAVVVVTEGGLGDIRNEVAVEDHQFTFRDLYLKELSIHYTGDARKFTFIQCTKIKNSWTGKLVENKYMRYTVRYDHKSHNFKIYYCCFAPAKYFTQFATTGPC